MLAVGDVDITGIIQGNPVGETPGAKLRQVVAFTIKYRNKKIGPGCHVDIPIVVERDAIWTSKTADRPTPKIKKREMVVARCVEDFHPVGPVGGRIDAIVVNSDTL